MNRKRIRDHRRIPRRFRFTNGMTGDGITTWPMTRDKDGNTVRVPTVHVAAVIDRSGRRLSPKGLTNLNA